LTDDDLARTRDELGQLIDDYPQTVVYSHAYNRWSTQPAPLYDIDPETGIARHCGSRMVEPMRYFTTDLQHRHVKCGTPDVDCLQCRMYSGGWSSKFTPQPWNATSAASLEDWLDMIEVLRRIFVFDGKARSEMHSAPPGEVVARHAAATSDGRAVEAAPTASA
jgi:hypothetical protein